MNKWNKYCEASIPKKQQLSEMSINETLGMSNFSMPGTHSHRKSTDDVTHRPESNPRNSVLKKRARTSVVEVEADGLGGTFGRPAIFVGKDVPDDNVDNSGLVEEKIRKLPAVGEGWDKKIKRKRSVGTVLARSSDGDGGTNRVLHPLETYGGQGFRSGSSLSNGGLKSAGNSLPRSVDRVLPKNESEKVSLLKNFTPGFSEEKLIAKGNKLNVREDSQMMNSSSLTKLRGTRARRNGHVMAANSSLNSPRSPGPLEGLEQPPNVNRPRSVSGVNHYKGLFRTGSTSPMASPMAQWVGQRSANKSRIRRTNIVAPISDQDELQMSSEGRSTADIGSKLTSARTSSPLLDDGVTYSPHKLKIRVENVPSPAQLCDSEEYNAGKDLENGLKEKEKTNGETEEMRINSVQTVSPSVTLKKRKRLSNKADSVDGVPRQGRSSRAFKIREKLDNPSSTVPFKIPKPATDKNKSKSGRLAVKKPSGRKVDRVQQTSLGASLDFTGEQVDSEELLAAARFASNAKYLACSSPFFKKMENVFSSVSLEDMYYLEQELKSSVELPESKSQIVTSDTDSLGCSAHREYSLFGSLVSDDKSTVTPLYQRVLSALIVEDEMEKCEEDSSAGAGSLQYYSDNIPCAASSSAMDGYHCNGSTSMRGTKLQHQLGKDNSSHGHNGAMDSHVRIIPETLVNGVDGPVSGQNSAASCVAYENMCLEERLLLELQSLDLYPENVPKLADGEDEPINKEIIERQKELNQQAGKKTSYLNKINEEVQKRQGPEEGALEQIALDRLVEVAYQQKLATNGRTAARLGLPKVSKEVSAGFTKRTLARCRRYEKTGKSDFTEPALRDILSAPPRRINDTDSIHCSKNPEISEEDFAKTGPILNKGKQKEVLLDSVGENSSVQAASSLQNSLFNGAKGKRSVRERGKAASRNCVPKGGRSGRKTKLKPKQKSVQIPTLDSGLVGVSKTTHPVNNSATACDSTTNKSRDVKDPLEEPNTELHKSQPIEDLGVVNVLGENEDLSSLLNLDDLQDNIEDFSAFGLDIPMDDLADLGLF